MKVDYHVHLEEGPYNLEWLNKTSQAMRLMKQNAQSSKEEIIVHVENLLQHLKIGSYDEAYLDLYLQQAISCGLKQVGIVDHLYRFYESRTYYEMGMIVDDSELGQLQQRWLNQVMCESMDDFIHFIQNQKDKWANHGIELRLGLEADYFPGLESILAELIKDKPWDYVIGSLHFFEGWGFDNPQVSDLFKNYELVELYERHFKYVNQAVKSGLFSFLGHLDNLKVFNYRPDEALLLPLYESVAKQLVKYDVATEINSGLNYRYPIKESCPSPMFLQILIEQGVQFTVTSDAHYPYHLGMMIENSIQQLKANGKHQIVTFDKQQKIMVEI